MKKYLTTKEAAEYISVAPATLKKWRFQGQGPRFYRPTAPANDPVSRAGAKVVRYLIEDLDAFIRGSDDADNGQGGV